jgi:hypothetical protein
MGILGNSPMTKLFLRTLAGTVAFHLVAAFLVYRLTEPVPSVHLAEAAVASPPPPSEPGPPGWPGTLSSPEVALARHAEPVILSGPAPAVYYAEPPLPFPSEPEAHAARLEEVRQVRAMPALQELDARAATRFAAAEARRAAMGIRVARR